MITPGVLEQLEDEVATALDGDPTVHLDVLGYGEISTVLRVEGIDGPMAVKRLPVMTSDQLTAYTATLASYLEALEVRGVHPLESTMSGVGTNPVVPYCVQPLQDSLLVDELREADDATIQRWAGYLAAMIAAAVDDRVGLDGQISNWAISEDDLVYLDVTTPLIRDVTGDEQLDAGIFIASLPWALRCMVRRFLLGEILSHYYDPRAVLLDMIGNLHKERLTHTIPAFLDAANRVTEPPITPREARRYYRSDALMWEVLQRLRRADRWWQQHVRRRRYPFLLPGAIQR